MAEESVMTMFKVILVVQLFFAVGITLLTYAVPTSFINQVSSFSEVAEAINLESVSGDVQQSLERQTDIPAVELGALVFYSGNILIDLLLNFIFAIPEMVGLIINGLTRLLSIDTFMIATVQTFIGVVVMVLYFIGIMQLLVGVRSGRLV